MLTLKLIAFGAFSLLLASRPVAAQEHPTASASRSLTGLLLAHVAHQRSTDAFDYTSMVRYETLWIVRDGSGAHIAASLPDVIVARKTGFCGCG